MDQLWKKVIGLDLRSVREKFSATKSWWWHLGHKPAHIERQYRQLLYLIAGNPDKTIVIWSLDLDEFWRLHAQDKAKYAIDCERVAGRVIQKNPKVNSGSSLHADALAETRDLYLASFGLKARKRRKIAGQADYCDADSPIVFSEPGHTVHCHSGSHHPGHHGGHHDAGHHAGTDHGGGHTGHSCGGHSGGHSTCGGHSSCGGHSGCGGH